MKNKIFFLAIFFLSHYVTCFPQSESGWTTLEFRNYKIMHPSDARILKNMNKSTFTIYFNMNDKISMEINDLAGYMLTLDSYAQQFFDNYFRSTSVKVIEKKKLILNNQPCYRIIAAVNDGHDDIIFKTMVYIWVKNNWAYNLKFVAAPDKYDEYRVTAQKVAESFTYTR